MVHLFKGGIMETKKCSKCGEVKPLSEFHTNGKARYCKICVAEYDKERRDKKNKTNPSLIIRNKYYLKENKRECSVCGDVKNISEFKSFVKNSKQQYSGACKKCLLKKQKEWRLKNPDKVRAQNVRRSDYKATWFQEFKNSENYYDYREKQRLRYYNGGKEKQDLARKRYYEIDSNREKRRIKSLKYQNNRYKIDEWYKIKQCLRSRIIQALSKQGTYKKCRTMDIVGCSKEYLKQHLESQFQDGMSWDNYGLYGWHIDHIRPCASFDLTDPEQQKECFHYSNLQPLWAEDNLKKGAKYQEAV